MVIQHPHQRRRMMEARNKVALEVLLFVYSLGATVVIVRTIMLIFGVTDRVWIGRVVYGSTSLLTDALANIPGFGHQLLGPFTMVDILLIALVILFPLGLLATSPRP